MRFRMEEDQKKMDVNGNIPLDATNKQRLDGKNRFCTICILT